MAQDGRRITCMICAVALAVPMSGAHGGDRNAPAVATASGRVEGLAKDGGLQFRGIPFARSTMGKGRWMPPEPVAQWTGARDATRFGAACPQPERDGKSVGPQSEDCLFLNVATPGLTGRKHPVLVMIHGGAYFVGSGAEHFEGAARLYNQRGVVVVSPNYRLGRFGFFSHPGLRAEAPGRPTGNYWLMDQIAALQWVKRNIGRFGGDPAQVTILGCSAGGSSINALMTAPAARGLFARASAHSGGGINNATRTRDVAEEQGVAFARRAGVAGDDASAIAHLRALSVAQILGADSGPPNYGAVVDGMILPQDVSVAFARGDIARVPFIAGSTSNEASVFGLMGFDAAVLKSRFGIDFDAVSRLYDPQGRLSQAEVLRQIQTDFIFTSAATAMPGLAGRWQPSYSYHFAYVPPALRGVEPGAPHCADMAYLFGSPQMPQDAESQKLAGMMQDYLANFIKTGNPNGAGLTRWPEYRGAHRALLRIDAETAAVPDFRAPQLSYWHRLWAERTGQQLP